MAHTYAKRHAALAALAVSGCWGPGVAAAQHSYPSTAFALPGEPTALSLPETLGGPGEWGEQIWVGTQGQVLQLSPRPDGSLLLRATTTLAPEAVPTALAQSAAGNVFLDAPHERVLVHRSGRRRSELLRMLATGPEPSGMVTDFIANRPWVFVANAGSNDLSLYVSRGGARFGAERRIPVGTRPAAVARLETDEAIAVANAGSGTVSHFTTPEYGFGREPDIAVGGAPSALAVADSLATDLNDDVSDDLLVADAAAGTVTPLLSLDEEPWFRATTAFPAGRPDAIALADLDRDTRADLVVANRQAGSVYVLHGLRGGRFGAPQTLASGLDPVAILVGQFGGDYQHDVAVADGRSRSVQLLLTPGDLRLSDAAGARHVVAAPAGRVLWSQAVDRRLHGLYVWSGGNAERLPIAPSARPVAARVGRRRGEPVVSYVRCRRGRCRPFLWRLTQGHEQALRVRVPAACVLETIQVWEARRAYVIGSRRCPQAAKGLWLDGRRGPPRRLSPTGRLGALEGNAFVFKDRTRRSRRWRIRAVWRGRQIRTLRQLPPHYADVLGTPQLDGGRVYWSDVEVVSGRLLVVRLALRRRDRCPELWPRPGGDAIGIGPRPAFSAFEWNADFAVRDGRIFYVDQTGVFEADPDRIVWRRSRC